MIDAKLLCKFRHMMTSSGAVPTSISDQDLIAKLKATTDEGRNEAMRKTTGLVADGYWKAVGLD